MASRSFLILILAGGLISLIAMGSRAAFGLFLEPVSSDLGWGREVFGLALAIQNIVWGLSQPFASAIADKYGSGKTLLVSSLVYAAGLFLMSQTSSPTELHMSAGVMIGLGLSGTGFGVVIGSVGRAVAEEKRSMALGIVWQPRAVPDGPARAGISLGVWLVDGAGPDRALLAPDDSRRCRGDGPGGGQWQHRRRQSFGGDP